MRSTGIQLRVSDLLFALQKRWKLIISLTFLGLVFGLLLTGMTYVQDSVQYYRVRGSFSFTTTTDRGTFLGNSAVANANDYRLAVEMMDAVTYVIRSDRVMADVINELEMLGTSVSDLRSSLSLSQTSGTPILTMTLEWINPDEGLEIWHAILDTAGRLIPQALMIGRLELINEPAASVGSSSGGGASTAMVLSMLGFAAGVGYAVLELLMHPTLTNVKDIESMFGLETLGTIPKNNEYFRKSNSILVQDESSSSDVAQNFSAAAYILRNRLGTKEKNHCFYVTSSINREGRSVVAANLAIQLSDMEHRTLLVDFDTHNPSLGTLFMREVDYNHSINALYRGEVNEAEAITTLTGYLDILPMVLEHNVISMDGMIIDLLDRLKEKYEYVIIDAPPVGKESDTLSLNQVASIVLFVVGYDQSTIPEIQSSLDKLDKSGIRVLGCIVNRTQTTRFSLGGDDQDKGKKKTRSAGKSPLGRKKGFFPRGNAAEKDDTVNELLDASKTGKPAAPKKDSGKKKTSGKKLATPAAFVDEKPTPAPQSKSKAPAGVAFPAGPRNIFEELLEPQVSDEDEAISDQQAAEALLRMAQDEDGDSHDSGA